MKVVPLRTQVKSLHEWYCWSQCRFTLLKDSSLVAGIFIFSLWTFPAQESKALTSPPRWYNSEDEGKVTVRIFCVMSLFVHVLLWFTEQYIFCSLWFKSISILLTFILQSINSACGHLIYTSRCLAKGETHLITWSALINNIIYTF